MKRKGEKVNWGKTADQVARRLDDNDTQWSLGGPIRKFVEGARWQRANLRTDEAVDLVARGICRRNWPKDSDFEYYWRRYGDDFRADARAAITELLGEG